MLVLTKSHSLLRFPCVVDVVQALSHVWPFAASWTATCQTPLSSTISQGLFKFMSIESMMLSNHLIFCCPLLFLPSIFTSFRVFPSELALLIRWPKYWSFSFSSSSSNEYSGLISFRIDWFGLLAGFLSFYLMSFFLFQDPIQNTILHLGIMFLLASVWCDHFSDFPCFWWSRMFGETVARCLGICLMLSLWLDWDYMLWEEDHRGKVPF